MSTSETPFPPEEQNSETRQPGFIERYFGFRTRSFLFALGGVVIAAFYLSNLLFGNASLEVLLHLQSYEEELTHEIARLKQENAKLQKALFELKELEPSE